MAHRRANDGRKRSEWWRSWLLVLAACAGFALTALQPPIGVADEVDTQHISYDVEDYLANYFEAYDLEGYHFEGFDLNRFDVEESDVEESDVEESDVEESDVEESDVEESGARRARRVRPPASTTTTTTAPSRSTTTTAPATSTPTEQRFVELINQERVAGGLPPLSVDADIQAVARSWSEEVSGSADGCSASELRHNPDYSTEMPTGWSRVAENVGCGTSVESLHQAFMSSSGHRANILDRDFTDVGVGVSMAADGTMWVTQDFGQY